VTYTASCLAIHRKPKGIVGKLPTMLSRNSLQKYTNLNLSGLVTELHSENVGNEGQKKTRNEDPRKRKLGRSNYEGYAH
jgi:hypothetical protein